MTTVAEYTTTVERIEELRHNTEEEDRPSDYACDRVLKILAEMNPEVNLDLPRASVSVGSTRGLRVTWSRGHGEVRLVGGGSAGTKFYVYSQRGSLHSVAYAVNGKHLAQHLRWALREKDLTA